MAAPRLFVEASDDDLVNFSKENEHTAKKTVIYLDTVIVQPFMHVLVRNIAVCIEVKSKLILCFYNLVCLSLSIK